MPNLLIYPIRGIKRRFFINFLNLAEKPECLVIAPGGCGSMTLMKFLDKFIKSNIYFQNKHKIELGHNYKPSQIFYKKKIRVILIKRNVEEIYDSIKSRNFTRNALNLYGDLLPFLYINILKDETNLKKKFLKYLRFFYNNWDNYNKDLLLKINYEDLYSNDKTKYKIKKFLNIENKEFINNFPKYKKYKKDKNFIDPSAILSKKNYNK